MSNFNIVLVGQPNCGKSTIFNMLSDIKTSTSNFSGTSVEIMETEMNILGKSFHIVDLPGVYTLNPQDEAEKVTLDYLLNKDVDLILNVVDSSMLSRSLELTVELTEFGKPMLVVLNMADEAERKGIKIFPEKLEEILGVKVVVTSALYGKGIKTLLDTIYDLSKAEIKLPKTMDFTLHIEKLINEIEEKIKGIEIKTNGSKRYYAIKSMEFPDILPKEIKNSIDDKIEEVKDEIVKAHNRDPYETISLERHHLSMKIAEEISRFKNLKKISFRDKIDRYLLSPVMGYFFLIVFFLIFFSIIFYVGNFISSLLETPFSKLADLYLPLKAKSLFLWHTIDGIYQGLTGAIGIVLPYFLPLIFLTSIFEDTGYMSRIAFLMDRFMHKIGLHGKSVVPFILGFGCSVPAIFGARIIENKRDRELTALLIPFIPCSARTAVIFALTAAFTGPLWAIFIYFFVLVVIAITGKILSKFYEKPMGLVLEIPDLKIPSLSVSFEKTKYKIYDFLKFALPFLILGSILLSWLELFNINEIFNSLLKPIVNSILGLPVVLGSVLIFGFFRKELIIIMITSAFGVTAISQIPMSVEQIIVLILFVTLYFPCFSTFVVMWKEFGKKIAFLSGILSVIVALIFAYLLKIVLILF